MLDVGCGSGWIVNGLAYHHKIKGLGIDINPNAISMGKNVSNKLKLSSKFENIDLFNFKTNLKFDMITSYGVLHHTKDCHEAVKYISKFLKNDGVLMLGLYNKKARGPFLDYFNKLKNQGFSENYIKGIYSEFSYNNLYKGDSSMLESIFYDQVYSPYETQHSFIEIRDLLQSIGYTVVLTSINDYRHIDNTEDWESLENSLYISAKENISSKSLDFGFFTIIAKKSSI